MIKKLWHLIRKNNDRTFGTNPLTLYITIQVNLNVSTLGLSKCYVLWAKLYFSGQNFKRSTVIKSKIPFGSERDPKILHYTLDDNEKMEIVF